MSGLSCSQACLGSTVRSECLLDETFWSRAWYSGEEVFGTVIQTGFPPRGMRGCVLRSVQLLRKRQKWLMMKKHATTIGVNGEERYGTKLCRTEDDDSQLVINSSKLRLRLFDPNADGGRRNGSSAAIALSRSSACRGATCHSFTDVWKSSSLDMASAAAATDCHQADPWLAVASSSSSSSSPSCRWRARICCRSNARLLRSQLRSQVRGGNRRRVVLQDGVVECAVVESAVDEEKNVGGVQHLDPLQLQQWVVVRAGGGGGEGDGEASDWSGRELASDSTNSSSFHTVPGSGEDSSLGSADSSFHTVPGSGEDIGSASADVCSDCVSAAAATLSELVSGSAAPVSENDSGEVVSSNPATWNGSYVLLYRRESKGKQVRSSSRSSRGLSARAELDRSTGSAMIAEEEDAVGSSEDNRHALKQMKPNYRAKRSSSSSSVKKKEKRTWSCVDETVQKLRVAASEEELWKVMQVFVDEGTMADLMEVLGKLKNVRLWRLALKLFRWMQVQEWYVPSERLYSKMISMVGKFRKTSIAISLFNEARSVGLAENEHVYGAMIFAYSRSGMVAEAENMVAEMEEKGMVPDSFVRKSMAAAMSVRSLKLGTRQLREGIPHWEEPNSEMSVEELLTSVLPAVGIETSGKVYAQVLADASRFGNREKMEQVLKEMEEKGHTLTEKQYNNVLSFYSRQGEVEKMEEVWEVMTRGWRPSLHSCTSMMDGYGRQQMFAKMEEVLALVDAEGLEKDQIMLEVLLLAYLRGRQWEKTEDVRNEVRRRGYRLTGKVFFVMIEEFAKVQRYDAMELAYREMIDAGYKPDLDTLGKLIDGCKEARNFELMEEVISTVPNLTRPEGKRVQRPKGLFGGWQSHASGQWKQRSMARDLSSLRQEQKVEMLKC